MIVGFSAFACSTGSAVSADLPVPTEDLKYADDQTSASAIFAGGCFWCTEGVFDQLEGVAEVIPGYIGGTKEDANYEKVCTGATGHAEAIKIIYNPQKLSFGKLLQVFFTTHDPTTKNRQGPDYGPQYRSAIFYDSDEQKRVAETYIKQLADAKAFESSIVTTLEPLGEGFFPAEHYHHNYVENNPQNPYVRQQALPKIEKVKEKFSDITKKETGTR